MRRMVSLDSEDLITDLPDHVLSHLFSFLHRDDAIRTGLLSKTWKHHFWTFLTDLKIDDKSFHSKRARKDNFVKFVNGILQHLKDVSFDVSSIKSDQSQIGIKACVLLKEFSGVQSLKLGHKMVQVLAHANDYVSTLPLFTNLVSLELALHDSLPSQEILLNSLRKTPILQALIFLSGLANFEKDILSSEEVPHCVVFSLKVVELKILDRYRAALRLGRYLLENCRVLELMSSRLCMVDAKDKIERLRQELLSTPRASSFAEIKVDEMSNEEAKIEERRLYTQGMLTSLSFGEG
ncbi:hypothetical protein L6164_018257 [Bauhinia variegata]|uniref:Uncharacterized protein n=1 Tax=Bauhinia variegata TaxID=167791 RepID=A0ACB9NCC0_BAUVA|nr:hypothetical protein L6164_018257 [Bauhinia variegata]